MPKNLKRHWFQILLTLADGPGHGQEIRNEVLERTEGEMHLWPGMLYGSLQQLSDDGLIRETAPPSDAGHGGGVPRYYAITPEGIEELRTELDKLEGYLGAARAKGILRAR